jgi:uncharacterized membrane protein
MKKIKENAYSILMMAIVASFIGFVVENTFKIFMNGYFDNRYMFLPFLLGYGIFEAALSVLIGTPKEFFPLKARAIKIKRPWNYLVYFLIAAALVSIGELALGFTVEKIAGFHYWDYSNIPLNFTRYTSLPTSIGFGLAITLYMGAIYPRLMKFFEAKKSSRLFKWGALTLGALLLIDFIVSFSVMIITGKRMLLWRVVLFEK